MRVLLVAPGASWSTADVEAGLRAGLLYHGVDVIQYRLDARIDHSKRWLHQAWRRAMKKDPTLMQPSVADVFYHAGIGALEMALWHSVDAVLIVSAMFFPARFAIVMRRAGLRVVVLFTESPYDLQELEYARVIDGGWTNERTAVDAFRAVVPRFGYLPHAWNPERHTPIPELADADVPAHDVVFVGTGFRERIAFLSAMDWSGIDLGLYGNWDQLASRHALRRFVRAPSPLDNRTAAALYRRAKIGLNLYRDAPGAESLNPRAYEIAACGAVALSTPRAEVADVFGADLLPTAGDPVAMSALVRAYLADDDERARIRRALPAIVAGQSWYARARQVIGDLHSLLRAEPAA